MSHHQQVNSQTVLTIPEVATVGGVIACHRLRRCEFPLRCMWWCLTIFIVWGCNNNVLVQLISLLPNEHNQQARSTCYRLYIAPQHRGILALTTPACAPLNLRIVATNIFFFVFLKRLDQCLTRTATSSDSRTAATRGRCMSSLQSLERWSRSGGIAPWRLKDPSWLARPNFCEAFISYHLPWGLVRWDISFWMVHIRIRIYKWNKMKRVKRTPHMSAFSHCSLNMLKQTIFACWVTPGGPTKNINISKSNCDQILSWLQVMVSNVSSHPSPGCTFGWSSGFRSAHGCPRSPRWCFTTV